MPDVESWIAERLLTGSIQGAVVIAAVWLVCRRFRAIPAPVQAALWWLASLKLLLVFVPLPAIALPLLPAPLPAAELPGAGMVLDAVATSAAPQAPLWISMTVAVWASALVMQAIRLWLTLRRLRGLVSRATPLTASEGAIASEMAGAVGLRSCPDVRLSGEIEGPLVSGVRRPVVLLPAALPDADRAMALCHEFVHVRRHDLALGWVPALAERLFFFHPLARLAAREYITAREAACDAGVVRTLGVSAGDYGRLLVRLGIAPAEPLPAAGGAPASVTSLRRRLDMLQQPSFHGPSRQLAWLLAAVFALFLMPFDVTARPVPPTPLTAPVPPLPPAMQALAVSPIPVTPQAAQAPRPVTPAAPATPAAPEPAADAPFPPWPREAFLKALEEFEVLKRSEEYRKFAEDFSLIAEQNDRLNRAVQRRSRDTELALLQQRDELAKQLEQLRAQQEDLTRQVREVARQQRELADALRREVERIENPVKPQGR